jgi:hypothetical protein
MRKASNLNFRQSLFLGTSIAAFACSLAPVLGQTAAESNETVIVTGTRVQGMTAADSATPITVLGTDVRIPTKSPTCTEMMPPGIPI